MSTTQDDRLLRLSTPLGKDVLLAQGLRCTEGISQLYKVELDILRDEESNGYRSTAVDPKALIGKAMCIEIRQRDGTTRYFNGMCSEFTRMGRHDPKFSKYRAVIVPKVWTLTQTQDSRIFQNQSVKEVLQKVFEDFEEVDILLRGTYEPRNYCVQYRESDWEFASRLMEEEGIYYYFEHNADSHRMIVADDPQLHRPCPPKYEIPFVLNRSENMDEWIGSIYTWEIQDRLRTGKVELWDYNYQLQDNNLAATETSRFDVGKNKDLDIYDFPGGYAKRFDGIDQGGGEQPGELQKVFQDRERTARIRQQEIDVAYKTIYGFGDACSLTPGYKFKLKEHPDAAQNNDHVVISVTHDAIQTPSYRSGEEVMSPYKVAFACIPHGTAEAAPFRPPHTTPKPVVFGSQTAIVVGPPGEEIFTDKYGRVKVHFHWDKSKEYNAKASCWLRVATNIAGNKWGTMFIPRVGQEVMVDFLEGDPDQPIIVGSVYNPKTMPHYELPKYKTLTYIKTRTSPDDGKGFNELRFEDKKGKEQVFVHSQKRYDLRVRGSMYETCGGSRQEVIGLKEENQPGGNLAVTVAGNNDLHVKEAMFIGIDKKLNETVKGEVVEDYQSSLSTMVKTKAELNAMEIIMEAKTKISLKVGGNCIVIDPTGITIAGTMVKINSGGFGTETGDPGIDDPLDAEISDNGQPGNLDRPRSGGGSRGRRHRTLRSQHYIAPPRPGEDARMTAFRNTLQNSAAGRHALEVYDRYGIQTRFDTSDGYYYDPSSNTMTMNPNMDQNFQTTGFVHEMNHGQQANEQNQPDINTLSRADYIDRSLQEEAHGDALANQSRRELQASGRDMSSAPAQSQAAYDRGYNQAVADAQAANPNATPDELEAAGRRGGEQAILDDYRAGRVQTSTPGNPTYPNYYGGLWDAAHPAPAGGGGTP